MPRRIAGRSGRRRVRIASEAGGLPDACSTPKRSDRASPRGDRPRHDRRGARASDVRHRRSGRSANDRVRARERHAARHRRGPPGARAAGARPEGWSRGPRVRVVDPPRAAGPGPRRIVCRPVDVALAADAGDPGRSRRRGRAGGDRGVPFEPRPFVPAGAGDPVRGRSLGADPPCRWTGHRTSVCRGPVRRGGSSAGLRPHGHLHEIRLSDYERVPGHRARSILRLPIEA